MEEKKGFFKRLVAGLTKTRDNIVSGIDSDLSADFPSIDDDFYEEIEEILIMGDLGINATTSIIEDLEEKGEGAAHQESVRMQEASDRKHQG